MRGLGLEALPSGGVMTSQILLDTLEHLRNDEFQKFKWLLQQGGNSEQQPPIPAGRLEGAEPWRTVDLMEQTFTAPEALQVTRTILRRMSRNDLVHLLSEAESGPEDARELRVDSNTVNSTCVCQTVQDGDTGGRRTATTELVPSLFCFLFRQLTCSHLIKDNSDGHSTWFHAAGVTLSMNQADQLVQVRDQVQFKGDRQSLVAAMGIGLMFKALHLTVSLASRAQGSRMATSLRNLELSP
ncbi:hypothetical protein INR49_008229, partial [Caranx melampygus]